MEGGWGTGSPTDPGLMLGSIPCELGDVWVRKNLCRVLSPASELQKGGATTIPDMAKPVTDGRHERAAQESGWASRSSMNLSNDISANGRNEGFSDCSAQLAGV